MCIKRLNSWGNTSVFKFKASPSHHVHFPYHHSICPWSGSRLRCSSSLIHQQLDCQHRPHSQALACPNCSRPHQPAQPRRFRLRLQFTSRWSHHHRSRWANGQSRSQNLPRFNWNRSRHDRWLYRPLRIQYTSYPSSQLRN